MPAEIDKKNSLRKGWTPAKLHFHNIPESLKNRDWKTFPATNAYIDQLPLKQGIYIFHTNTPSLLAESDKGNEFFSNFSFPVYIGQSQRTSIRARCKARIILPEILEFRALYFQHLKISYSIASDDEGSCIDDWETILIDIYGPIFNKIRGKKRTIETEHLAI
jgi:hypothetical protein